MKNPRVTKRERKSYLSYELSHRVYCSTIYPITAPNGSTVILYGHEDGLRIIWRGGRARRRGQGPLRQSHSLSASQRNDEIDHSSLESDDVPLDTHTDYEEQEEELDADHTYHNILDSIDVSLGKRILCIASLAPSLSSDQVPLFLRETAVLAAACASGSIRVLQIPLKPPTPEEREGYTHEISDTQVSLSERESLPISLDMKLAAITNRSGSQVNGHAQAIQYQIAIASGSRSLSVWSIPIKPDGLLADSNHISVSRVALLQSVTRLQFHPSVDNLRFLLVERAGAVRIYDPGPGTFSTNSNQSSDPNSDTSTDDVTAVVSNAENTGTWLMAFQAPFSSSDQDQSPFLVARKRILDAAWVLGGRNILALLEDGEWGMWDVSGPSQSPAVVSSTYGQTQGMASHRSSVEDFSIRGYLGSSSAAEPSSFAKRGPGSPGPSKRNPGFSKFAPMTPNTRKAKAENLFTGTPKVPGRASRGGISAQSLRATQGPMNESVVLWYNNEIFSIANMQAFWQRSISRATANSSSAGFGSLYSPGMSHLTDFNLVNENITSISQLPSQHSANSVHTSAENLSTGHVDAMNVQRNLVVATEHRLIISQSAQPTNPLFGAPSSSRSALFGGPAAHTENNILDEDQSSKDQQMLDAGQLDIGGMDRLLDGMAATSGATLRTRKVGFAAFTE